MKLGLRNVAPHPSAVRFGAAFPTVPAPPPSCDYHARMLLDPVDALMNDSIGDCVPAGKLRLAQMRVNNTGNEWRPSADQAVSLYTAWAGYDPISGQPDHGTDLATAQAACAQHGIRITDQLLDVSLPCMVTASDLNEVRRAIWALVGVGICLALPTAWQSADVWDIGPTRTGDWAPGSWGSHFVVSGKYDAEGLELITWGQRVSLTWRAFATYAIAVPAGISRTALDWTGHSPVGLDWTQMEQVGAAAD